MEFKSYNICGLRVDDVTEAEVLRGVAEFVAEGGFHLIVTPNVDHVITARRDAEFRSVVERAALSLPDGKWLVRGAKTLGVNFREGIAGRKLVIPMCELAAQRGWKVYILASRDGIASLAAERMREMIPGLQIVGARSPSMNFGRDEAEVEDLLSEMDRLRPDLLFLGIGAPKSEKWMDAHRRRIPAKVGIGVGYAFDVIAGKVEECPRWLTRTGFEWAYRLLREPRRLWKRYLVRDPQYFYLLLRQKLAGQTIHWAADVSAHRHHDHTQR